MHVSRSLLIYNYLLFIGLAGCSGKFQAANVFSTTSSSSVGPVITPGQAGTGTTGSNGAGATNGSGSAPSGTTGTTNGSGSTGSTASNGAGQSSTGGTGTTAPPSTGSGSTPSTGGSSGAGSSNLGTPISSTLAAELANPTFTSFPTSYFTLTMNNSFSVNGVTLKLTADADMQVVNGSGTILWHTGSLGSCDSTCAMNFQNDGNLVLSKGGSAFWGASTYNGGAMLTLSSVAPYFTVRDGNFRVMYPTAGQAGPVAMTAASLVGPTAVSTSAFLNSLAVNSHVQQNGISAPNMMTMLNYLGVKTIRDGWNTGLAATYTTMAQAGVKFDLGIGDPYASDAFSGAEAIAAMAPGALTAVEGPNEINNWSFVCNGVTSPNGWPNNAGPLVQKCMTKLFSAAHADAKLGGADVYNLTWGGTTDADKYGMFDLTGQADYGNIHFYPGGQPYLNLQTSIAGNYHHVLPNQAVITETGYDTANVSQAAQAILTINLYLAAFQQGFKKTYIYELYDEWQTYGLFKDANTPKLAATAIHNLTTFLADSGTLTNPGQLNYSIANLPSTAHTLLLQKSNGKFELVVWNEVPVYANGADVSVSPVSLNVSLGKTVQKTAVYDPISGTNGATATNVSTASLSLGAHALILEITP